MFMLINYSASSMSLLRQVLCQRHLVPRLVRCMSTQGPYPASLSQLTEDELLTKAAGRPMYCKMRNVGGYCIWRV